MKLRQSLLLPLLVLLSPSLAFAQTICTAKPIDISQTTSTDVHTFVNTGYICAIQITSATAQNVGVIEGTGVLCAQGRTALAGVSSAGAPTTPLAVGGTLSLVSGVPFMAMAKPGDHLCVLQDGTGVLSGTITFADLPPGP